MSMRPSRIRWTCLCLAALTACGEGTSEPNPPTAPVPEVTTVSVTPPTASLFMSETLQLTATVKDQQGVVMTGKAVTWSSSDLPLATVSASGLVIGVAEGTVTITAAVDGKSGGASLRISKAGLDGPADTPAAASIPRIPFVAKAEDYTATHPELAGIFISHNTLMLSFAAGVTTRQANVLLDTIGATIVGGITGVPGSTPGLLFLRVPTQSHPEMIQLLAGLRADTRVAHAVQDALLGTDRISRDNNGTAADWTWELTPTGNNWGLELSRVPQMWNLNPAIEKERSRTGMLPSVTSILDVGFADSHLDLEYGNLTLGDSDDHGTHVAGIIGAKFNDGFGIDGVNPFARMQVRAGGFFPSGATVIERKASIGQVMLSAIDSLLRAQPGIRVLNLSLGYRWSAGLINTDNNAAARQLASDQGALFVDVLRGIAATGGSLPVIIASAGNDSRSGVQQAKFNSPMAAAALIHGAAAVIVVEAVELSAGSGGATRYVSSNVNGHVSAPGKDILSTIAGDAFGLKSGTSMAAPHVAGLVGYLFTLLPGFPAPTLAENKARDLIAINAIAVGGNASPRMDAFATMLDADRVLGGDAVLRKLLDIDDGSSDGNRRDLPAEDIDGDLGTGDGRIDMSDFRRWRDWLLQVENPAGLALDGAVDNLKKDLNADGRVGTPAEENVYPRGDFNGDGTLSRTALKRVPGAMGGQNVTDLQVLRHVFSDPNYLALDLPGLLNSADLRIEASACLLLPGVLRVQSAIRVTGADISVQVRLHDNNPEQVYTAPVQAAGYTASAAALDASGAEVGRSEANFPFQLGSDASWSPTCPPPPSPPTCPVPVINGVVTGSLNLTTPAELACAASVTEVKGSLRIGTTGAAVPTFGLVNLPLLTKVEGFVSIGSLQTPGIVRLPNLQTSGTLNIEGSQGLVTLELQALSSPGAIEIQGNPNLKALSLPSLGATDRLVEIEFNLALQTINLGSGAIRPERFDIEGNPVLQSVTFGALTTLATQITIRDNPALRNLTTGAIDAPLLRILNNGLTNLAGIAGGPLRGFYFGAGDPLGEAAALAFANRIGVTQFVCSLKPDEHVFKCYSGPPWN